MTTTLQPPAAAPLAHTATRSRGGWAWTGLGAGLGGLFIFIVVTGALIVDTDLLIDNALVLEQLDGKQGWVWAFQTMSFVVAVLAAIFGAGLRRRLAGQAPAGSMLPDLSALGLVLVAALTLVGGGISTEMFHSLRNASEVDPDTVGAQLAIFNTLAWVWAGGILTTGAVAVAGLRHASVGKGLARFSAAMTFLIVATQVTPFQYLAALPVALFLIVCSISMLRSERSPANAAR